MKKLILAMLLVLLTACSIQVVVLASNDARNFEYLAEDIGSVKVFETGINVNGTTGFTVEYDILSIGINAGETDAEKRLANTDYIEFTLLDTANNGIRIKVLPFNGDNTYKYNRMQADLYSVAAGTETYMETVETYLKVLEENHTISAVEYLGYTFVSVDGISFIPTSAVSDLGNLSLTVKIKSSVEGGLSILGVSNEASAPAYGEWSGLGQTQITPNADGTVEYNVKDKRADQYNGAKTLVMRENVVNLKGYDVTKPIVLEYSYDIVKTMGVWYGVCLGRSAFGDLTRLEYVSDGSLRKDITSNNMITSDGVMFQMGTSKVQSQVQNGILSDYVSNQGTSGYVGTENLDKLIIEIGETSTKMTFNGTVIFESLTTKRADFTDGKCYPYFHFIGSPANPYKENKIIIKGINTPSAEDGVRVQKGGTSASFAVDNYENQNGALKLYYDASKTKPISSDKFIYDIGRKTLTVMSAVFADFELGANSIFATNDGGMTKISFIFVDPALITEAPIAISQNVVAKRGQDTVIEIDVSTAEFSRFYGNGIAKADYFFYKENGKSYVKIYSTFTDALQEGDYTFTIVTENANSDLFEGQITVRVGEVKEGNSLAIILIVLGATVLVVGVITTVILFRRKKKNG